MKIIKFNIIGLIAILLSSCLGPVAMKDMHVYAFNTPKNLIITNSYRSHKTLLVAMPLANPGYETSNMIYESIPYNLRYFASHRWVAPPAQMIMPILADTIRATGYFKVVATVPFSGVSDYRLVTHLVKLQQEFIQPTSQVRLVMQVAVINSATNAVIASRRFKTLVAAQSNDPYSGVLATNKALNTMASQIAIFVKQTVR